MADSKAEDCPSPPAAQAPAQVVRKVMKRRRTSSHNSSPSPHRVLFMPGFDSSTGCRNMSLSELRNVAKGLNNMYLAHEIAVDKDFMLENIKPDDSEFEAQVKKIVHQAFWDVLSAELSEQPPVYTRALSLLSEVKGHLVSLLLPRHHSIKERIQEKLDLDLIAQQANNAVLDLNEISTYILDLMSQLCAPVRDEEISLLQQEKRIVPLLQGIMKTLKNMELDMANFILQSARPLIMSQSVAYEKKKFQEFLDTQADGLEQTKAWLVRHRPQDSQQPWLEPRHRKLVINRILTDAYVELLEWDESYHVLPETLAMDAKRIFALRDAAERTAVSTAAILLLFSNISGFVVPADSNRLKETIKGHIDALLEGFTNDEELLQILPNVALQVIKDVNDYLAAKNRAALPESTEKTLVEQIKEIEDPNNRIRDLVQRRILDFNKQAISTARSAPLQVPPGLSICQRELGQLAGRFVRLVSYNRDVFGDIYEDIIENRVLCVAPREEP